MIGRSLVKELAAQLRCFSDENSTPIGAETAYTTDEKIIIGLHLHRSWHHYECFWLDFGGEDSSGAGRYIRQWSSQPEAVLITYP